MKNIFNKLYIFIFGGFVINSFAMNNGEPAAKRQKIGVDTRQEMLQRLQPLIDQNLPNYPHLEINNLKELPDEFVIDMLEKAIYSPRANPRTDWEQNYKDILSLFINRKQLNKFKADFEEAGDNLSKIKVTLIKMKAHLQEEYFDGELQNIYKSKLLGTTNSERSNFIHLNPYAMRIWLAVKLGFKEWLHIFFDEYFKKYSESRNLSDKSWAQTNLEDRMKDAVRRMDIDEILELREERMEINNNTTKFSREIPKDIVNTLILDSKYDKEIPAGHGLIALALGQGLKKSKNESVAKRYYEIAQFLKLNGIDDTLNDKDEPIDYSLGKYPTLDRYLAEYKEMHK